MKLLSLTRFFSLFVFVFFACDGDDNNDPEPSAITLKTDKESINIGMSFRFTVEDDLGNDVTSESTIYINDSSISGSVFTPEEKGQHIAKAVYKDLNSSSINLTVSGSSLGLTLDKTEALLGDKISFSVTGFDGTDITSLAKYYVNDVEIPNPYYVTDHFGYDTVRAAYDGVSSEEVSVLIGHKKNVLIEDYTGTWCGWCPRVAFAIELVEKETENAIPIAIHVGDPFEFSNYPILTNLIGLEGYPTAMLNRTIKWSYPEPMNVSQVLDYTEGVSSFGLSINPTEVSDTSVSISIGINDPFRSLNNHKLVVYIVESGLLEDQANYTSYYGGGSTLYDFEHNNTLRKSVTSVLGDEITSSDFNESSGHYIKNYTVPFDFPYENSGKFSIAAILVKVNDEAVNTAITDISVPLEFE